MRRGVAREFGCESGTRERASGLCSFVPMPIRAVERNTSVSALVKGFLVELASEEPGARGLEREERELRARTHHQSVPLNFAAR
jgi:hypothetical protein